MLDKPSRYPCCAACLTRTWILKLQVPYRPTYSLVELGTHTNDHDKYFSFHSQHVHCCFHTLFDRSTLKHPNFSETSTPTETRDYEVTDTSTTDTSTPSVLESTGFTTADTAGTTHRSTKVVTAGTVGTTRGYITVSSRTRLLFHD